MFFPNVTRNEFIDNILNAMEHKNITFSELSQSTDHNPIECAAVIYGIRPTSSDNAQKIFERLELGGEYVELTRVKCSSYVSPTFHYDPVTAEIYTLLINLAEQIAEKLYDIYLGKNVEFSKVTLSISKEQDSKGEKAVFEFKTKAIYDPSVHEFKVYSANNEIPDYPSSHALNRFIVLNGIAIRSVFHEIFGYIGFSSMTADLDVIVPQDSDDITIRIKSALIPL